VAEGFVVPGKPGRGNSGRLGRVHDRPKLPTRVPTVGVSGGAFIGALWPVSDRAALAFARDFYEQLTSKRPIGEAVRLARLHVHEQFAEDPSWLAYSCFADPTAQFEPGHSRENSPIPSDRL
jgi:hypothetical protein